MEGHVLGGAGKQGPCLPSCSSLSGLSLPVCAAEGGSWCTFSGSAPPNSAVPGIQQGLGWCRDLGFTYSLPLPGPHGPLPAPVAVPDGEFEGLCPPRLHPPPPISSVPPRGEASLGIRGCQRQMVAAWVPRSLLLWKASAKHVAGPALVAPGCGEREAVQRETLRWAGGGTAAGLAQQCP